MSADPRYAGHGVKVLLTVVVLLATMLVSTRTVRASGVEIIPGLEFREEYNDNIFLSTTGKQSDFISTFSPSLRLVSRSDRANVNFRAGLNWLSYARIDGLDAVDALTSGSVQYRLSERTDLSGSASYTQASRPDTINEISQLASSSSSDRQAYSLSMSEVLDELSKAGASYSYRKTEYDNPGLLDVTEHAAGATISRDLSAIVPRLTGSTNLGFSRSIYTNATTDNYSVSAALNWLANERFVCFASGGVRYTYSSFTALQVPTLTEAEQSRDNWGLTGSLGIRYTGEKWQSSLALSRDFASTSGQIGASEQTSASFDFNRLLTEKLGVSFSTIYSINQADAGEFSVRGTDDLTLRVSTGLQYDLSRDANIGLQYSYYSVDYRASGTSAEQNILFLRAQINFPVRR